MAAEPLWLTDDPPKVGGRMRSSFGGPVEVRNGVYCKHLWLRRGEQHMEASYLSSQGEVPRRLLLDTAGTVSEKPFVLAAAFFACLGTELVGFYGTWALIATLLGAITRGFSLYRNNNFRSKVDLQSAIGVHHSELHQKAQGFMGGSFNTREFFHHQSESFLLMVFVLPVVLIVLGYTLKSHRACHAPWHVKMHNQIALKIYAERC